MRKKKKNRPFVFISIFITINIFYLIDLLYLYINLYSLLLLLPTLNVFQSSV